ncbi:DUF1479-domain-containing protein [Periconia macrospinosa]|uniref:DUF1479-domain-containing protein n=1 Tax=Periconia macrospinosa TaxID=97972 RepID=A0A2V1EG59_9PLEO|nr:DUF1479-domain-containing protein [Periconia macrospinosa]
MFSPLLRHCVTRPARAAVARGRAEFASARRALQTQAQASKREGDISDAFASLSGQEFVPLAAEYAHLKTRLIRGNEDAIRDSWERLLRDLRDEIPLIVERGSQVIPQIDFKDLDDAPEEFSKELKKRGVAVIRGVVSEREALGWKDDLREYIRRNPHTKAFPSENPQVFELYWSRAQLLARAHPNMLKAQRFLMSYWHSSNPSTPISTRHPISYCDRLRMRLPGDARFALGPHVDGGSVERWDERGYGLGHVYDSVWRGEWEAFDPWESSCRLPVVADLHQGVGACTAFRMFQGWMSLSTTGPHQGTLLVNPLLAKATAYYLLRPFFSPKINHSDTSSPSAFLDPSNWSLDTPQTSWVQGATPGRGQELSAILHPHLRLADSMIHVPTVSPGDYVAWHCDTIHAVDRLHQGTTDSSVLYIPACPLTEDNARYLATQRDRFVRGVPSPDFGGGVGESAHVGRVGVDELKGLHNYGPHARAHYG